jgi:hypothetical protein
MIEKKTTRPEIPINWERVDELLEAGCYGTEIAPIFGMHHETFYDRVYKEYGVGFTEYSCAKKAKGESALREAQYNKALGKSKKGDNAMLIWLGKQRLNQRESIVEFSVSPEALKPLHQVMGQFAQAQEARKIELNKVINAPKSE